MWLDDKLIEIRNKPEKERIRYVWIMVIIFMAFTIIIWIFSVKNASIPTNTSTSIKSTSPELLLPSENDDFTRILKGQAPSLESELNNIAPEENNANMGNNSTKPDNQALPSDTSE